MTNMVFFIAPKPRMYDVYEDRTDAIRISRDSAIDEPDFLASYTIVSLRYKHLDILGTLNRGFR